MAAFGLLFIVHINRLKGWLRHLKKYLVIIIALAIFQNRGEISHFFNPPPDYSAQHEESVILYATSWCGYCTKARQFLAEKGIPYYEYDIEASAEGREQYDALGGNGVPLLLVNGTVIKGYNPAKIIDSL